MKTIILGFLLGWVAVGFGGPIQNMHGIIAKKRTAAAGSPTPEVLWLKFAEGSGTAVNDESTAGTGDATTNASWITGKSGSGYALDNNGTTNNCRTGSLSFASTQVVTVCFWVYFDSITSDRMLVETGATWYGVPGSIGIYSSSTGKITAATFEAGGRYRDATTGNNAVTVSAWNHIAVVMDNAASSPAGTTKIYVNGADTSAGYVTNTITTVQSFSGLANIGSRNNGASTYLDGRIDDVRIYSTDQTSNIAAIVADPQ